MADGGDGFVVLKQGKERTVWMTDLDASVNYVKAQKGPITAQIEGRITLADSVTVPEVPTPEVPANGTTVTVKPVIKAGQATINTNELTAALERAAKEKGSVSFDLGKEKSITLKLTKEQVAQLIEKGIPLAVNNDHVKLSIPLSVLSGGKDFAVKLTRLSDISHAKSPVYEFTIIIDGKEIHQFADPITLTFNVDPGKVKNTKDLKVYYYNETKKVWELIPGAIYSNGKVEVKTSHFSIFTVFEVAGDQSQLSASAPTPVKGQGLPNTATNMYNFLLLGMLFVAAGVTVMVRRRRRLQS
ncbi:MULTISPECIES: LPXTG cell wall anchor domain-containing protein [Bacillaceae]|uniref:LPXTG cell wall anchor domain-containing protein n=1 Tax=Bacillaceae TaxID=186817 RepID=UPI001F5E4A9B|nr:MULTISPECIES: LPXTG cell wall anchor domain-containing protein [Bacillaceae]